MKSDANLVAAKTMFVTSKPDLAQFMDSTEWGPRGEQFCFLADALLELKRPVIIIETGCMRPNHMPSDDGQSTLVWDWIINNAGGQAFSIDISHDHVDYTEKLVSQKTLVIRADSLQYLSCLMPPMPNMIDLVYLDSLDFEGDGLQRMESALHHVAELAAVWKHLAPGAIIAVDDCYGEYEGKQALIECFFNLLQIAPIMTGPIYAWRKPARAL
jgi:hypothetical protein